MRHRLEKALLSLELGASFQGLPWRISNSSPAVVGFAGNTMGATQQTEGQPRGWSSFNRAGLVYLLVL